jgi:hypothetical protein
MQERRFHREVFRNNLANQPKKKDIVTQHKTIQQIKLKVLVQMSKKQTKRKHKTMQKKPVTVQSHPVCKNPMILANWHFTEKHQSASCPIKTNAFEWFWVSKTSKVEDVPGIWAAHSLLCEKNQVFQTPETTAKRAKRFCDDFWGERFAIKCCK